jgi:predicted nuclease of predicted toxin-antitoxin system
MRLYVDEDLASPLLARLLRNAGHDVQLPPDVGLNSKADPVCLTHAIRDSRVFLSRNYCDFQDLHNLIMEAQGHHPGILVVRRDNDPRRNLTPRGIVRAIRNLQAAGLLLADSYYELNPWQ